MKHKGTAPHPEFLIIGAPRSGTTSLHEMLQSHPQIFMSRIKEPHYFASIDFPFPENEILNITKNKKAYSELFKDAGGKLSGEASSYYLADPEAPKRIHDYNPRMKLIAILRDPVDRAHSHYLLYNRRGSQPQSFSERVNELIKDGGAPVYDIVGLGKYGSQLENYLKYFPARQILVVKFDELTRQPVKALEKILRFLAVDTGPAEELATHKAQNTYQVPKNKAVEKLLANEQVMKWGLKVLPRRPLRYVRNNVLLKKGEKEAIDEQTAKRLRKVYEPEIRKLNKLFQADTGLLADKPAKQPHQIKSGGK